MLDLLPRVVYQIKHRLKRACFFCRGIAQLVEHRSPKPRVVSSNLTAPATQDKDAEERLFYYISMSYTGLCKFFSENLKFYNFLNFYTESF